MHKHIVVCSLELGSISQSQINFQNSKRQLDPSCYSSTNCPGHRRVGGASYCVQHSEDSSPSTFYLTKCLWCHSLPWVKKYLGPCFSETFCTSFQHSQELSSNVSTQPIHTHHFGLFKAVVHHDFNLFVCLFVASPPPQLCSEICRCMYECEKFMVIIWISQRQVHGHGEPAYYTCTFTLLNETSEWPSYLTLKFGFRDPDVYSLRPVSVIQFKLSVFPEQWSRWRNL